ncbi:MAG: hypothetical protein ACTTKY_08170 [Catonella sp.]
MENLNTKAAYKALKLTRILINISLTIIFIVLLFWGNYNPAAAFALIFYNALHWLLLSNFKSKSGQISKDATYLIELNVLRITLFAGILLHIILGYGFMYKLPIKIEELKILPFALALVIIIFRYLSYFYFKTRLSKKNR